MARPDHTREIKHALTDARALCEKLGLLTDRKSWLRQAGGVIVRCVWHQENTPSMSVRLAADGTISAKCFGCGEGGDVLSLIAAVRGLTLIGADFPAVLLDAAELAGLHSIARELETGETSDRPVYVPPPVAAQPERTYPPAAELGRLLASCVPCADDAEVAAWLCSRAIDPERAEAAGVAALPASAMCPRWASYQGQAWTRTGHRLIVPMRDELGVVRSVRAGRVVDGESPKRLPPGGHKASALVMACELGAAMLAGTYAAERVVVVEGEPDFLTWTTRPTPTPIARVGIVSGSWTEGFAARFPVGAEVFVRTDHDRAGDAYAETVMRSLQRRGCFVRRSLPVAA